jgi:hypothetical protein
MKILERNSGGDAGQRVKAIGVQRDASGRTRLINIQPQYKSVALGAKAPSFAGCTAGLKPRPSGPTHL